MKQTLQVRQRLGKLGENIASLYLQKKGFRILERNFKRHYGEIDIIALDGKVLVFVEVKTRIGLLFGTPQEAVTPRKLHEVVQTAQFYKSLHEEFPESLRIDVVAILLHGDESLQSLQYIPNVTG